MNNYNEKAIQFLTDTATTFSIEKAVPQKKPNWSKDREKHGINYSVTLKNKNGSYTFDFWDSIANAEKIGAYELLLKCFSMHNPEAIQAERILEKYKLDTPTVLNKDRIRDLITELTPKEYDVLACLDVVYDDCFEDFCASMGYDNDSITAQNIYNACLKQDSMLRRMFTHEQIEQLQDIN